MTLTHEKKDGGVCIGEHIYLGDEIVKGRICLALKKGESMNYGEGEKSVVSFP